MYEQSQGEFISDLAHELQFSMQPIDLSENSKYLFQLTVQPWLILSFTLPLAPYLLQGCWRSLYVYMLNQMPM